MRRAPTERAGGAAVLAAVALVRSFAERGVLRDLGESPAGAGGARELRFGWHGPRPVRLRLEPRARRLVLVGLLPGVPFRSAMDRALRRFVAERSSPSLPAHRRLDPRRLRARVVTAGATASIVVSLGGGLGAADWEEACRRTLKLANEVYFGFLTGPYESYMVEHFGAQAE